MKNKFKYLSIIIFILMSLSLIGCSDNSPEGKAYGRAKDIVIARGKYPDTVKFLDDKKYISNDGKEYDIFGEATSENGFGATVHLTFRVKLTEDDTEAGGFKIGDDNIVQK